MILIEEEKRVERELEQKRLICEIAFSAQDIDTWRAELLQLDANKIWQEFPALAAVITVGIGIHYYHEGDYWSSFPEVQDKNKWGEKFEQFLQKHPSLESFRAMVEQRALRFVAPILAHGGIPQYYLPEYFHLVTKYADPDEPATELIDLIIENPKITNNVVTSVRRFLREGGEAAEDLVARTLAVWQSRDKGDGGGNHGLPVRVVEAFNEWHARYAESIKAQKNRKPRPPRPELRMEPGNLWVYLHLPRCDNHPLISSDTTWLVGERQLTVSRQHQIPISQEGMWKVTLGNNRREIPGINDTNPVLFFDSTTGKVIQNPTSRRLPEKIWAVFQDGEQTEPKPVHQEALPAWHGYQVAVFNLVDHSNLMIGDHQYEVRRPFFYVEEVLGITGIHSTRELSVMSSPPKISWRGDANLSFSYNGKKEGNIDDIYQEDFQMWFDKPGEYEFTLRGPFGQNVNKRFVLLPGIQTKTEPEILWPDTKTVRFEVSSNNVGFVDCDGIKPPFLRSKPHIKFKALLEDDTSIDLDVDVPKLQWQILISDHNASGWKTMPLTLQINDLEDADYPRFVCRLSGSAKEKVELMLSGRHGTINPPQGHNSVLSNNCWEYDLRMVRDQVKQSGLAEQFKISVKDSGDNKIYCGHILTIRPHWDLNNLQAKWKSIDNENIIEVAWSEQGNPVDGRWLVLIPVWRPWEQPVAHKLDDKQTSRFILRDSKILPGHYIVRAIHADWGCEDWTTADYLKQITVDVYKEIWPDVFASTTDDMNSVKSYTEGLFAHWYRHELVNTPPYPPLDLTSKQILEFLDYIDSTNRIEPLHVPKDGSGALTIFCMDPIATTEALESISDITDLWQQVLPSSEIVYAELNSQDKKFVAELTFQYNVLNSSRTVQSIKRQFKKKNLSLPLQDWHKKLSKQKPPPDEIIFLCEKFDLSSGQGAGWRGEYEELKREYQQREAV